MRTGLLIILLLFCIRTSFAQTWEKLSLNNDYLSSIEKSPWGILIGENDKRLWKEPFNGIYISENFGASFRELALPGTGITDIEYFNNRIFVTTYYFVEDKAGLYVSEDKGKTWRHLGIVASATEVEATEGLLIYGTYSHGLWLSRDDGNNWRQYFGDGFYGNQIDNVEIIDGAIFVTTNGDTYTSNDGENWNIISNISQKNIRSIQKGRDTFIATGDEIYISDDGTNWRLTSTTNVTNPGKVSFFDGIFYLTAKDRDTLMYEIFKSEDKGETWQSTEIDLLYNEGLASDIDWFFSNPSFIIASFPFEGLYRLNVKNVESIPFLNIPWEYSSTYELVENIFSFFDHSFPLLGYPFTSEPELHSSSTTNYFGITETEPKFYYSSHNGVDFALPYGTPILVAHSGIATSGYDPEGLGHYIRVNHLNGYATIYAHLQDTSLISEFNTDVLEGEIIGYVGMSGRTTGPHLHFEVELTDKKAPENKVDPFGWKNKFIRDPWEGFLWEDLLGVHIGPKSFNLWKVDTKYEFLSNKQLIVENNSSEENFTIFIEPYIYPKVPIMQNKLTYITGTSMLINAYNMLGQKIPNVIQPVKIEIDISNANLENLRANSLRIYKWNEEQKIWKTIPTVYDAVNMVLIGKTDNFSKFAVFGIEETAWINKIKVTGTYIGVS